LNIESPACILKQNSTFRSYFFRGDYRSEYESS